MAVFDLAQQRVCIRVVYDGAASAGKTTNLRQLAELFATQRTSEVISPEELDGRTLYFDWLQIAAGMVCGLPLLCQVISVPGQVVLTPRRRHLLHTADVVVQVVDSAEHALERARDGLLLLDEVERERGVRVPLVVQANKQDQVGAIAGAALVAAVDRGTAPVVEAIATDGIGVIDTFVAAVRAAVRDIQARVERGDVRLPVHRVETADETLDALAAETVDPEWQLEMLLEEASNALAIDGALDEVEPSTRPETGRPSADLEPSAAFPTEHVPPGFVWPAHTGRQVLRALSSHERVRSPVALDAEGIARTSIGDFIVATSEARRFDAAESGRQALVRAAREWTQLDGLLAPETVLVVQPGESATWLWTIVPRIPSIADLLRARTDVAPERLSAYGSAVAHALKLQAAHGLALELSPRHYGERHGKLRYTGELGSTPARDVGRALAEAFAELASFGGDIDRVLSGFEAAFEVLLTGEERALLDRASTWSPDTEPAAVRDAIRRAEGLFRVSGRAA